MANNNTTTWEIKALTGQLAQDVAELKEMLKALAKNQADISETLKRPLVDEQAAAAAPPPPEPKRKKPRNASCWHVGVRLMQHYAAKLEPRHRRGLMRYAKVHQIMQDETFRAFLEKHVDRTQPMDNNFVDTTMIPAMAQECKAMVRTLKALKPADVDALMAAPAEDGE